MPPKLDTAADVLQWAQECEPPESPYGEHRKEQWERRLADDTETAEYIAECVRKAEALSSNDIGKLLVAVGAHRDALTERWVIDSECVVAGLEIAGKRSAENERLREAFDDATAFQDEDDWRAASVGARFLRDAMKRGTDEFE